MNIKVLTDEQIDATLESLDCLFWDVSEGATHDFARAIEQAVLQSPEVQAWKKDAELYRGLRQMHWSKSHLCVVRNPKTAVKLGSDCPSGERLDVAIRAAMEKQP